VAETDAKVALEHVEGEDCRVARDEVGELFTPAPLLEFLVELLQRHAREAHNGRARLINLPRRRYVHEVAAPIIYMYICMYIICMYVSYVCTCVCVYVGVCVSVCVCVCVYTLETAAELPQSSDPAPTPRAVGARARRSGSADPEKKNEKPVFIPYTLFL